MGIGSAIIFDFENDPAKYAERRQVLQTLVAGGAKLIDTAAAYGRAEDRIGDLVADVGVRDRVFLATKFRYNDSREVATASMRTSLKRLKTDRVDLMQAWNVGDANYDFGLLREWKRQGLCRYVGLTTSSLRQYEAFTKVIAREKPDFVQVNYSLGSRSGDGVLPAARTAAPQCSRRSLSAAIRFPEGRGRRSP